MKGKKPQKPLLSLLLKEVLRLNAKLFFLNFLKMQFSRANICPTYVVKIQQQE